MGIVAMTGALSETVVRQLEYLQRAKKIDLKLEMIGLLEEKFESRMIQRLDEEAADFVTMILRSQLGEQFFSRDQYVRLFNCLIWRFYSAHQASFQVLLIFSYFLSSNF